MIRLTRINRALLVLNSDLIELVETTPDTMITLTTGQKIIVLETPEQVSEKVIEFRRRIYVPHACATRLPAAVTAEDAGAPAGLGG